MPFFYRKLLGEKDPLVTFLAEKSVFTEINATSVHNAIF